jgi:hypothetical protein
MTPNESLGIGGHDRLGRVRPRSASDYGPVKFSTVTPILKKLRCLSQMSDRGTGRLSAGQVYITRFENRQEKCEE